MPSCRAGSSVSSRPRPGAGAGAEPAGAPSRRHLRLQPAASPASPASRSPVAAGWAGLRIAKRNQDERRPSFKRSSGPVNDTCGRARR